MSDAWFKPKAFGYGATPSNWKGWAATLGFAVLMVGWSLGMFGVSSRRSVAWNEWVIWAAGVIVLTVAFIALCKAKTDGAWKWRGFDRGK